MANPIPEENIFVFKGNQEIDRKYTEIERLGKTHWQSDYACDILKSMQEQEQRRRPLEYLSTQLNERQETMQLLQEMKRTYKLSRCAFHLAMYYLDRFADQYKIRADKFHLVGLICLHIAAQIEDTDAIIPRYSEMNRWVRDAYTATEYKVVERKILRFFNFEMIRPTTASFVQMFSCTFLTHTDFQDYIRMLDEHNTLPYQRYESFEQMLATLAKVLLRLATCTLYITSLGNVAPSLLAAACIAAVRQVNGVKRWSQYLTDLTSYTEAQVVVYSETIAMQYYYQITPPPAQVPMPEPEKKELPICEHISSQSNQNWSSPDSGFEEHLTASTDFKEPLNASTDFKEPLTATTDFKKPLTAGTDFKELVTVTKDFKEPVAITKEFVVLDNGTTLEVETHNIISVQLLEPAPTAATPYRDPGATLKRSRQEDDIESGIQPYKKPKSVTELND
ncbi:hypothetical protein KR032_001785 [Drosophila birchii]|nr:hypothetical protein KR032_001785 [Drosophila birchii]